MPLLAKNALNLLKLIKQCSVENQLILVTALNPIIGYKKAAEIAKKPIKNNEQLLTWQKR